MQSSAQSAKSKNRVPAGSKAGGQFAHTPKPNDVDTTDINLAGEYKSARKRPSANVRVGRKKFKIGTSEAGDWSHPTIFGSGIVRKFINEFANTSEEVADFVLQANVEMLNEGDIEPRNAAHFRVAVYGAQMAGYLLGAGDKWKPARVPKEMSDSSYNLLYATAQVRAARHLFELAEKLGGFPADGEWDPDAMIPLAADPVVGTKSLVVEEPYLGTDGKMMERYIGLKVAPIGNSPLESASLHEKEQPFSTQEELNAISLVAKAEQRLGRGYWASSSVQARLWLAAYLMGVEEEGSELYETARVSFEKSSGSDQSSRYEVYLTLIQDARNQMAQGVSEPLSMQIIRKIAKADRNDSFASKILHLVLATEPEGEAILGRKPEVDF